LIRVASSRSWVALTLTLELTTAAVSGQGSRWSCQARGPTPRVRLYRATQGQSRPSTYSSFLLSNHNIWCVRLRWYCLFFFLLSVQKTHFLSGLGFRVRIQVLCNIAHSLRLSLSIAGCRELRRLQIWYKPQTKRHHRQISSKGAS
jgi:hypothetical protein